MKSYLRVIDGDDLEESGRIGVSISEEGRCRENRQYTKSCKDRFPRVIG